MELSRNDISGPRSAPAEAEAEAERNSPATVGKT